MNYTPAQVARRINCAPSSVRQWGRDYADFLSSGANPPPGRERVYDDRDLRILATVAAMRRERRAPEEVRAALDAGELVQMEEPEGREEHEAPPTGQPSELVTRLTATVARYEGELSAVREERDRLRLQLADEQAARLAVVEVAARLSGILESLEEVRTAAEEKRPARWMFWRK